MILYGIIGYPLGHSFSQRYFTEKFQRERLSDHIYRKFELESAAMIPSLPESQKELRGFNVTIPYKVEVMKYLDFIDPVASEIGAVNTVRVSERNGRRYLEGFNTDAPAFMSTLEGVIRPGNGYALVLGTGGASRSVTWVLREMKINIVPVSRSAVEGGYTYATLPAEVLAHAALIVNTTPVGMVPVTDAFPPLDYSILDGRQVLYDLIYNPAVTEFLRRGKERGCTVVNGEGMFISQAELAWKIWTAVLRYKSCQDILLQ